MRSDPFSGGTLRLCAGSLRRTAIASIVVAGFSVAGAAQDFMASPGAPASTFPKPDRPVAGIVSPMWHNEKARDTAGEPRQGFAVARQHDGIGHVPFGECIQNVLARGGIAVPGVGPEGLAGTGIFGAEKCRLPACTKGTCARNVSITPASNGMPSNLSHSCPARTP